MPRSTPVSRRTALSVLVGLAAAPLAACSPTSPVAGPSITPPTAAPDTPGATTGSATAAPAAPTAPTAPPPAAVATVAPTAVVPPMPTLLPTSPAVNATGTALSSTSAALSATATTEARAALGTYDATSTTLAAAPGTPVAGASASGVGSAVVSTPGGLAAIPVVSTPAVTATPRPATASLPDATTNLPTVAPTVAPMPVFATVAPAVQMVVNAARARFDRVNALHFTLAVEGAVYLDDARSQRLTAADGDLVRPDRVSLTARVAVSSIVAQVRFIQVAEMAYITNILSGRWQNAPSGFSYDPRVVFDPNRGVSAVLGGVQGWTLVENVRVGNADTQHLRGAAPAALAAPLVSNSLRGDFVDVDIYVEGRSSDVLKLILAEQPAAIPDGSPASKWTLDLSRQNENITIAAPVVGATATR